MTHNIVAQFSCSLDEHGNFKEYRVVAGSVFNEEYNETLDSGTLVLSQVSKEDRLSNIKPYDFVRVFDKSTAYNSETDTYAFDKVYLVDNFDERENNIKEHIFGYTINLMSETKLLEKIQCPNLTVTHDVVNGKIKKKTIYQVIKQYMELYVPKIKFCDDGQSWSYKRLILLPGLDDTEEYNETTLRVNFNDDNFRPLGHGSNSYVFECLSEQLPSNIDYDSVEVVSISLDGDVIWNGEVICTFNHTSGNFRMDGITENIYYGSNVITYKYKYLYTENDFYKRFNVPCADLPFNCPTLRQLLTTLMQQVGCIPVVRNRTLGFLDFQKDAVPFGNEDYLINNTVNYIRRSLSSDSYVNTLVNLSNNVLDSGNEVVCETLGFRNRNSVLLKQTENLCLETNFPIYKVNKFIMHAPGKYTGYILSSAGCFYGSAATRDAFDTQNVKYKWPVIYYCETLISNNTASIKFRLLPSSATENPNIGVVVDKIYFWGKDGTKGYYLIEERQFGELLLNNSTLTYGDIFTYHDIADATDRTLETKSITKTFENLDSNVVGFIFSGKFIDHSANNEEKQFTFIRWDRTDHNVDGHDLYMTDYRSSLGQEYDIRHPWFESFNTSMVARYDINLLNGFQSWDISKLIVEKSVRQLLDRDFQQMHNEISSSSDATIDKLAKYVYGTVEYSIGSTTISGFSDVYVDGEHTGLGWIQKNYTYIENIVKALEDSAISPLFYVVFDYFESFGNEDIYRPEGNNIHFTEMDSPRPTAEFSDNGAIAAMNYTIANSSFIYYNSGTGEFGDNEPKFFTGFFFDIYYQPLNSFNMSYVKENEDVSFSIAQYDGNASGLTDFDRLSIHEQEQVNRIGNETLSINQRTTDFNDIQNFDNGPLVFRDDVNRDGGVTDADNSVDYIIFKRSFTINNNCFNASYIGSKDAVLKDYFTSIRTKYRSYQYIDYNQSVLRKEKDLFYVRISQDYYNGDDRILLGEEEHDVSLMYYFIYNIGYNEEQSSIPLNISYEIETHMAKTNSVNNNNESIIRKEIQTVKNSVSLVSTKNTFAIIYEQMDNVGAGPYITDITNDANLGGVPQSWQIWDDDYNIRHQVSYTNFIDFYSQTTSFVSSSSRVATQIKQIEQSPIVHSDYPFTKIFSVVDNRETTTKRTFYKDYAERINHTVQFIYYAPNKDVLFSEDFVAGTPMIQKFDKSFNFIYVGTEFYFDDLPHEPHAGDNELVSSEDGPDFYENYFNIIQNEGEMPYLRVNFARWPVIKMAHYDSTTNLVSDIAAFKNPDLSGNGGYVKYFFSINDTKTDYVMSEKNGILYRRYKVQTYTQPFSGLNPYPRSVVPLYDEDNEEE